MTNYEVGDEIIKDITLSNKNTKAEINPSDQISAIDIYEDFNSPTLYAEITFDDKIGLINDFPIIGEELFEITFQTPGLSYPTTYKFNTYAVSDVQQQMNGKGYTYTLKCVSKEQLTQSNINIVHSYNETINDIVNLAEIQTKFIGKVTTYRSLYGVVTGIYIEPLYIWNGLKYKWNKIINYKPPKTKYFLYPHLLMIPNECGDRSTQYKPLNFLDTVINRNLDDFSHITNTFSLEEIE